LKLPKIQSNAKAKQRESAKEFESLLDEIVKDGRNVFGTVEKLMEDLNCGFCGCTERNSRREKIDALSTLPKCFDSVGKF